MLKEEIIEYSDGNTNLKGFWAQDERNEKKPVVLIVHDWFGLADMHREKARKLAQMGYIGFAVDMYGDGKLVTVKEEAAALMNPLINHRENLLKRIESALTAAKKIKHADVKKIAIMGYCFGGTTSLDLARSGADIQGAISFHGRLIPSTLPKKIIKAKVLVLHGYDDPNVPPEEVISFAKEMNEAKANWEIDMYSGTVHSFTKPTANDLAGGNAYNKQADERSWQRMRNFLEEIFV